MFLFSFVKSLLSLKILWDKFVLVQALVRMCDENVSLRHKRVDYNTTNNNATTTATTTTATTTTTTATTTTATTTTIN